ncbi:MAG TPA: hypothetical protein VNT75_01115 [Symbiobacteriaceae bacterium]|nr:hypothetical protein [Symbiobacteriaceae bacterium]
MLTVVIGITYGSVLGIIDNVLLFRHIANNRRKGEELLKGVGGVFLIRYLMDAISLIVFALVTRHALGIVAAALSITVAVKISLFIIYARKGGRID